MIDEDYVLLAKFLFNPSLTTIWDLKRLLERKGETQEILKKLLEPIVDFNDEEKEKRVTKERVDLFLRSTEELLEMLVEKGYVNEAILFLIHQFSVMNYLLTSYLVWHYGLNDELQNFFGKGKFEEGAFEILLKSLKNGFWYTMADKVNAKTFVSLALLSQFVSLELFIKTSKKINKEKILGAIKDLKISDIIPSLSDIEGVSSLNENAFVLKAVQPMLANLVVFTTLLDKSILLDSSLVKKLGEIATTLLKHSYSIEGFDSHDVSTDEVILSLLNFLYSLDKDEDVDIHFMEDLGMKILKMRITRFYDSKLIPLLLPADAQSIPLVLFRTFDVNLIDAFNPVNLMRIQQDIIHNVLSVSHPVEAIFKRLAFTKSDKLVDIILNLLKNPIAYIPLVILLGWPEVQFLEAIIMLITDQESASSREEEINRLIETLNTILKDILETSEQLLNKYENENKWVKRIVGYFTSRITIHLTSRLSSPNIRDKLLKSERGKELMDLLDKFSRINERIFGKPQKEPEVSDLFT